jgi:hypothetical protein
LALLYNFHVRGLGHFISIKIINIHKKKEKKKKKERDIKRQDTAILWKQSHRCALQEGRYIDYLLKHLAKI